MKSLLRLFVCAFLTSSLSFGQAPPLAVPFIVQVSPASLTPGATTLTLTGANFNQNATVTLAGPGVGSTQSASTTVNSSGTNHCVFSFFRGDVHGVDAIRHRLFDLGVAHIAHDLPQSFGYTLTLTPVNGFAGNVALSCSGAPTNTTCSVSPSQVTLNGTSSGQATVTVTVGKNTTPGTRTLTLSGTSGSVSHSVAVSLTVN